MRTHEVNMDSLMALGTVQLNSRAHRHHLEDSTEEAAATKGRQTPTLTLSTNRHFMFG